MKKMIILFLGFVLVSCDSERDEIDIFYIQRVNDILVFKDGQSLRTDTLSLFPDSLRVDMDTLNIRKGDFEKLIQMNNFETFRLRDSLTDFQKLSVDNTTNNVPRWVIILISFIAGILVSRFRV